MKRTIVTLMVLLTAALFAACGSAPAQTPVDLTGVTSYYVRANGNDSNAGTSEDAPFKTLAKAIQAASGTRVKTITVIGRLNENVAATDTGSVEILVTGSNTEENAVLASVQSGIPVFLIKGNSKIRFENITITGSERYHGLLIDDKTTIVTLGKNCVITGNSFDGRNGAGVFVNYGTLNMESNAVVSGNKAGSGGGGVAVYQGNFVMQDEACIKENEASYGGGIQLTASTAIIKDNASILNNKANGYRENNRDRGGGGGVFVQGTQDQSSISILILQDNATIKNNTAVDGFGGGGILIGVRGSVELKDNSLVTENRARKGGGVFISDGRMIIGGVRFGYEQRSFQFETGNIRGNFSDDVRPDVWDDRD